MDPEQPKKPRKKKQEARTHTTGMAQARYAKRQLYEARLQQFAVAYADPTSISFMSGTKSYLVCHPEVTEATARVSAKNYLSDPLCREMIAEIQAEAKAVSGITSARYIKECLDTEDKLLGKALSGGKGAAGYAHAAVKYRQLAGKAAGLLVERVEDMTPPERRALGTAEAIKVLQEQYERVLRLREANPLPAIPATTYVPFEIVEEDNAAALNAGRREEEEAPGGVPIPGNPAQLPDEEEEVLEFPLPPPAPGPQGVD